jgi:hypothetical protein
LITAGEKTSVVKVFRISHKSVEPGQENKIALFYFSLLAPLLLERGWGEANMKFIK